MRIAITGTPGTGKTTLARRLARQLGYPYHNEKTFAAKKRIGKMRKGVREIPLDRFSKAVRAYLKEKSDAVFEGHLLCEVRAPFDAVFVLSCPAKTLYTRLQKRKYSEVKIQDNVFCERTEYCWQKARQTHGRRAVRVQSGKGIKESYALLLKKARARGA